MKDSELRMIETMLKKQDELNSAIMKEFGLTTISKEQIDLATLDEIGEFTHELKGDWCWWKKSQEPVDRNKVLEELPGYCVRCNILCHLHQSFVCFCRLAC